MSTNSKIQDQTFLFTGTLTEFTREEAEALVATHGGKVLSGVTGKLNYLVAGEDAGSKLEKAKDLGTVKILTEKEFLKMIKQGDSNASELTPVKKAAVKAGKKASSTLATGFDVKIGTSVWMVNNLDVDCFANGDKIPEAKTDAEWDEAGKKGQPAWCYYENDPANGATHGRLYNWFAVNDPRGLAPEGWTIPGYGELLVFEEALGQNMAGKKVKTKTGWFNDGNGNNSTGFSATPSGSRTPDGRFVDLGKRSSLWTTGEGMTKMNGVVCGCIFNISWNGNAISRTNIAERGSGFSVRCMKKI